MAGSEETLLALPSLPAREAALRKLDVAMRELASVPETVEELRLIEARAALTYFTCWQALSVKWKGTGRKPIPEEWKRIGLRQSLVSGTNRNATHPVNAVLNYAYGVLESQVRIAASRRSRPGWI